MWLYFAIVMSAKTLNIPFLITFNTLSFLYIDNIMIFSLFWHCLYSINSLSFNNSLNLTLKSLFFIWTTQWGGQGAGMVRIKKILAKRGGGDKVFTFRHRGNGKESRVEEGMHLCSRIAHFLRPGGICVSVVPDARRCVCRCEKQRSLLVETRAQLILRLIARRFGDKHWQKSQLPLTRDHVL